MATGWSVEDARRSLREAEEEALNANAARHEGPAAPAGGRGAHPLAAIACARCSQGRGLGGGQAGAGRYDCGLSRNARPADRALAAAALPHSIAPGMAEDDDARELYLLALQLPNDTRARPTADEAAWRAALQALQADGHAKVPNDKQGKR